MAILHGPGAPSVSAACLRAPWNRFVTFTQPERTPDANRDGYHETVFRLSLPPAEGCRALKIRVVFDAEPRGHAVDIGDSPTVDGYGGDRGTTGNCAEIHVSNDQLWVTSRAIGPRLDSIDKLLKLFPRFGAGSTLDMVVSGQRVEIVTQRRADIDLPSRSVVESLEGKTLFALDGEADPRAPADARRIDYDVYLAFNRVVHEIGGSPASNRVGRGVARVELRLAP